jgi:hypothetical protein
MFLNVNYSADDDVNTQGEGVIDGYPVLVVDGVM